MITTASNKISSYKKLLQLKADDYWIKEGIDERKSAEETLENYYELLKNIYNLTSEKYRIRNDLAKLIQKIDENNFWWEDKDWKYKSYYVERYTFAKKSVVKVCLEDILNLFDLILVSQNFGWHKNESRNFYGLVAKIYVTFGKLVEEIHQKKIIDSKLRELYRMKKKDTPSEQKSSFLFILSDNVDPNNCRKDSSARYFYDLRNFSAHNHNKNSIIDIRKKLNFEKLLENLDKIISYIKRNPV